MRGYGCRRVCDAPRGSTWHVGGVKCVVSADCGQTFCVCHSRIGALRTSEPKLGATLRPLGQERAHPTRHITRQGMICFARRLSLKLSLHWSSTVLWYAHLLWDCTHSSCTRDARYRVGTTAARARSARVPPRRAYRRCVLDNRHETRFEA